MQFDPEEVDSFEVGYKASEFGGRLNYNFAVFYNEYIDIQIPGSVGVDTTGDGVNDTFSGVTTNAGEATIAGLEFEGSATIFEELFNDDDVFNMTWVVGVIDAEYDTFIDAFGNDVADERVFQNTPELTASTQLVYDTPFRFANMDGNLSLNTLLSFRSETSQFETPNPFLDQDAFTLVDANLRWETADGTWGFFANGKNLTDEEYIVAGYNFVAVGPGPTFTPTLGLEGTLTGFYGDPRTFPSGLTGPIRGPSGALREILERGGARASPLFLVAEQGLVAADAKVPRCCRLFAASLAGSSRAPGRASCFTSSHMPRLACANATGPTPSRGQDKEIGDERGDDWNRRHGSSDVCGRCGCRQPGQCG